MIHMVVHGGAWHIPDDEWAAHQAGCQRAQAAGLAVLEKGGSALSAVAAAIRVLEDDPTFDAATGSFLNQASEVECSAGLMSGQDLQTGAVIGVSHIHNPIDAAMVVLEKSEHCIFTAKGAEALAQQHGIPMIDSKALITEAQQRFFESLRDNPKQTLWLEGHDTVGAIALDQQGHLAAGNSTGGIPYKAVGRVGDAALPGLGYYADDKLGAFICTGQGEAIMRSTMGMRALHRLAELGPQLAAEFAIKQLGDAVSGYGGIIVMSPNGEVGMAYNTTRMAHCLGN